MRLDAIDAHAEGGLLRLVVGGFPTPKGRTMGEKLDWAGRHADTLRRALILEPRGHADLTGAVLTEPVSPGAHAGLLFMHGASFSALSGHSVIAATTIALERGLVDPGGPQGADTHLIFDTPAGTIRARAALSVHADGTPRVSSVTYQGVPSFVESGGVSVRVGHRDVRADVAFGGAFYAIVDAEVAGLPLVASHRAELRRAGMTIAAAIDAVRAVVHPVEKRLRGIAGVVFTSPAVENGAHLRNVTVFADGHIDRSPCGTGTAAVMAVLEAMGLLDETALFVHEGPLGTRFTGQIVNRSEVGGVPAIVSTITGSAWITGEHTLIVDEDDPLGDGFIF